MLKFESMQNHYGDAVAMLEMPPSICASISNYDMLEIVGGSLKVVNLLSS